MLTITSVLQAIAPLSSVEGYSFADTVLRHPDARLKSELYGGLVTVGSIEGTWRSRLKIALDEGIPPLPGLRSLVQSFDKLDPEAVLRVSVVETEDAAGMFWFAEKTNLPVGFVVVDRK